MMNHSPLARIKDETPLECFGSSDVEHPVWLALENGMEIYSMPSVISRINAHPSSFPKLYGERPLSVVTSSVRLEGVVGGKPSVFYVHLPANNFGDNTYDIAQRLFHPFANEKTLRELHSANGEMRDGYRSVWVHNAAEEREQHIELNRKLRAEGRYPRYILTTEEALATPSIVAFLGGEELAGYFIEDVLEGKINAGELLHATKFQNSNGSGSLLGIRDGELMLPSRLTSGFMVYGLREMESTNHIGLVLDKTQ